jgi:uncharacterized protein YegP (UPF0339 family)
MVKNLFICVLALLLFAISSAKSKEQANGKLIPAGYRLFEELHGDLNNDGRNDLVLIIKGTDKNKIVQDEQLGKLDRNRRGIMIFFNTGNGYKLALENRDCFSSENEDGGIYFAPELYIEIEKGNLYINYSHGRYGAWEYTFRYRNGEFVLIGYDTYNKKSSCNDAIEMDISKSFNFLTKKTLTEKTYYYADSKSKTDKKWNNIVVNNLVRLTDIKDFDGFEDWN